MTTATPVLLHGFLGASADWSVSRPAIEAARGPAWVPDLPGHGATPLDVASTDIDAWAGWLDAEAPAGPLDLVGYSMGGRVALAWAARSSARVRSLVLVSSSPGIPEAPARAARARVDDERADAMRRDWPAWLDAWYRQPLFAPLDADATLRAAEVARRQQNDPVAMAQVIRALSPGRAPDRHALLASWPRPVLLVVGALDARYAAMATALAGRHAHVRTRTVEGAGHALLRSHGATVGALVAGYLAAPG